MASIISQGILKVEKGVADGIVMSMHVQNIQLSAKFKVAQ